MAILITSAVFLSAGLMRQGNLRTTMVEHLTDLFV